MRCGVAYSIHGVNEKLLQSVGLRNWKEEEKI
jgi:hypothetical protein